MAGKSVLMTNLQTNLYVTSRAPRPPLILLRFSPLSSKSKIKHAKEWLHVLPSRHISAPSQVPASAADNHRAIKWGEICATSQVSCVCLHCSHKHCCNISHHGGDTRHTHWMTSEQAWHKYTIHFSFIQSLGSSLHLWRITPKYRIHLSFSHLFPLITCVLKSKSN